ncbi:MAG: Hpt domain-containing protein [Spirochaetota bacterium]|nr:Hpt domain-containing protein [Spirochaetota bacterium]
MDNFTISPVDLGKVQKMIGTSLDLYKSLVDIFTEESIGQIEAIEESVLNLDPVSLDNSAHSFKSSLATIGAYTASNLVGQLEIMGKAGSVDGSEEILKMLKLEQKQVIEYFESKQWIIDWKAGS